MNLTRIRHIILVVAGIGIPIGTALASSMPAQSKAAVGVGVALAVLASLQRAFGSADTSDPKAIPKVEEPTK